MNVDHLKYFHDAAKAGSLKKAAEQNHVSPGAISQAILRLEQELNTQLLHHSKNSFHMTDQGKVLVKLSQEVFTSIKNLRTKMEDAISPFSGSIYFGTQQSIASTFLPGVLKEFKEKCPAAEVGFTLGHSIHMKNLLDERHIDFAITMDNLDFKAHPKVLLHTGEFVFISKGQGKKIIDEGLLLTGETEETKQLQTYYQAEYGASLPIQMRIDGWGVIKTMALEGHGIGFVPDYILLHDEKRFVYRGLKLPKITYRICCVYPENQSLNAKANLLLEIIKSRL